MENIFNVSYNTKLDRLEIPKETIANKIVENIKKNKFISFIFISFIVFSGVNFYLIYNFMKILENIWKELKEALELDMQDEESVMPKEIFITTLEVAVWVENIQCYLQIKL